MQPKAGECPEGPSLQLVIGPWESRKSTRNRKADQRNQKLYETRTSGAPEWLDSGKINLEEAVFLGCHRAWLRFFRSLVSKYREFQSQRMTAVPLRCRSVAPSSLDFCAHPERRAAFQAPASGISPKGRISEMARLSSMSEYRLKLPVVSETLSHDLQPTRLLLQPEVVISCCSGIGWVLITFLILLQLHFTRNQKNK